MLQYSDNALQLGGYNSHMYKDLVGDLLFSPIWEAVFITFVTVLS